MTQYLWSKNKIVQLSGKLFLILIGILVALAVTEFLARLLGPPFNPQENILGSLHQCDRLVGWRGIPNMSTTLNTDEQYEHKVVWNSRGMHDDEHLIQKEKKVFRILMIGDSFVQASEVEEPQTSHQILEDILNSQSSSELKFEVISGGVLGWGPAQELMYFRSEGRLYNPDLVLILWVPANDLSNNLPDHVLTGSGINCYAPYFAICNGQFDLEPWFSAPGINPTWKSCSTSKKLLTTGLNYLYTNSTLYQRLALLLLKRDQKIANLSNYASWMNQDQPDETLSYAYQLTDNIYAQLAQEANQIEAKTAFVIVPYRQVIYYEVDPVFRAGLLSENPSFKNGNSTLPNQTFTALMTNRNLPVLDLHPHFVAHYKVGGEPLHWISNFHWNITGNRIAAEFIAQWLLDQKLLPLQKQVEN
ncbi:MAG: hypothetical protein DWQ04_22520 [Chloroflexi bacterium]|nr:MAG: hypothetical protein DWQ04_22520 [Chloroflexota bacterium]